MLDIEKNIDHFISSQFPAFYKEEGPELITFMTNYYEFLQENNDSRSIPEYRDVDTTLTEFLNFFKNKYMVNIPDNVVGDRRKFQKHILDLYRSKGSEDGIKLLFRLLFDEDISIYVPSVDILKSSDGTWKQESYIEITSAPLNNTFHDKEITGVNSGAKAIVTDYREIIIKERIVNCFIVEAIRGEFEVNELLLYEGLNPLNAPRILGSPQDAEIISSISGIPINEILQSVDEGTEGVHVKAVVTENFIGSGIIRANIINGGTGYSYDAEFTYLPLSNTSGTGAEFSVASLRDTSIFLNNTDELFPYLNMPINSETFSLGANDTSTLATANLNTIISDGIIIEYIEIGTINKLRVLNPGRNYDGDITITVTDPYTPRLQLDDGNGGIVGNNAVLTGKAVVGTVVSKIRIVDSGLGYNDSNKVITLRSIDNPDLSLETKFILSGIGDEEGRWTTSQGFLNSDKYIQDSYYYQEYSYEIFSSRSLDRYIDVLRKTMHMVGNEVFGRAISYTNEDLTAVIDSSVTIT
jgi:hypothetical protein